MSEIMTGDWDAAAHVRFLRDNGGAMSLYTADLLEHQHRELATLRDSLSKAREQIAEMEAFEGLAWKHRFAPQEAAAKAREQAIEECAAVAETRLSVLTTVNPFGAGLTEFGKGAVEGGKTSAYQIAMDIRALKGRHHEQYT